VAAPLYVLYEFGIIISRIFAKSPLVRVPAATDAD
jgi:Sec-independent protein secretion pathway component TatC